MTPAARLSAAIEVLDRILAGAAPEPALTGWGRANRYAGSGDRHAVRDRVYQALRRRRSAAWVGGAETGRGLVLGLLRLAGEAPETLFTGDRFAPPPLSPGEAGQPLDSAPDPVRLDVPDWLWPQLSDDLGDDLVPVLEACQSRAPVWLRVNRSRASIAEAAASLAAEGIATRPHDDFDCALEVIENTRKVSRSIALSEGLVELQDAASQAVTLSLGDLAGLDVLDYCAGAGGKALHLADLGAKVTAHDVAPGRMRDLEPRAARAGLSIARAATAALPGLGPWPLVLVDAPCSGSGTWRRDPMAKWALTPERLAELGRVQAEVLDAAAALTAPGGRLAFVTCSILSAETRAPVESFLSRSPGWQSRLRRTFLPGPAGDGFSVEILARAQQA
ncbi:RsmB/NOP family class I SAM-dependent RNA methyltransferase [Frigidibacter sp. ROC022]|uniref:RsmB/NOP family class I SAM-dependent RNA methyltransferase n=1 Tax=Frigidibacter sp. ROC022 TaxID=2971796 RepID=UPI00215A3C15|nr:RsmB/NOP family class I SAM-dependent RNA methyltransferase [Frigidibacter sp. ROC022]MCR8725554.1 RsmB/NOP family class I SAM-dependent RNA methyltransferase [Frigidibacter sp. ROC022]